jgi:hypothetical protein
MENVEGSRLKAQGLRLKVEGSRLKAQGSRLKAQGSRLKAQGSRNCNLLAFHTCNVKVLRFLFSDKGVGRGTKGRE